jgi:hypothetical protein
MAAGSSGIGTIQSFELDSYDKIAVITGTSAWGNPDACGGSGFLILQTSNSMYKETLATILSAATAGKTVSFWVSGCIATPWGGTAPLVLDTIVNF